ncbi:hypothetical protein ACR0ST_11755 [Aliidiomarina sp. Khilg15.8]
MTATMEEACFRDYNVVLIEAATATFRPDFCKEISRRRRTTTPQTNQ